VTQRERYHVRRAKGICATCPAKVERFWKCRACRVREALAAQRRRAERRAA